jgi:hypothetical protein
MPLVELENIRLYYEEHGRGPALVLVHGTRPSVRTPKSLDRKEVVP